MPTRGQHGHNGKVARRDVHCVREQRHHRYRGKEIPVYAVLAHMLLCVRVCVCVVSVLRVSVCQCKCV
jgi:hypothetical protein